MRGMRTALRVIHAAKHGAQRCGTTRPLTHAAPAEAQEAGIGAAGLSGTINATVRDALITLEGVVESVAHIGWSQACAPESAQFFDRRQTW